MVSMNITVFWDVTLCNLIRQVITSGRNVQPPSSISYREYGSFKFLRNFSPTFQLRAPHQRRQQSIYHEVLEFKRVDEKQEEIRVRRSHVLTVRCLKRQWHGLGYAEINGKIWTTRPILQAFVCISVRECSRFQWKHNLNLRKWQRLLKISMIE